MGGVIAILPLLVGCSPENDIVEQEKNHHHARKISFDEFSNDQNALRSLKKIEDKNEERKSSRIVYDSVNHFYVDTDRIMLSEENGHSFYTFLIYRDYETSKTENLVLKQDDSGQFSPLLFEYAFSEQDIEDIKSGGSVADVGSKTVIKQPAEIGLDGIFGNVNKFTSNCQRVTVSWCSYGVADHEGGFYPEGGNCQGHQEVSWDYCEGGNGGANTDPGYTPQPTQNPYTPHQGGQSGWGSTAGNNPNHYVFTVPLVENWTVAQNNFIKGLSFPQRTWLMDPLNVTKKNAVVSYLIANQFSEESCAFVEQFMQSSLESGLNLDFEASLKSPANIDKTAIDTTTQNGKRFDCVYKKMMKSPSFKNLILNTFQNSEKINLKFEIVDNLSVTHPSGTITYPNATCEMTQHNGNFYNKLKISSNMLNGTKTNFAIAKTLLHECIHAYLNIKKLNCGQGSTIPELNGINLPELLNVYYQQNCSIDVNGTSQSEHTFMFDFMIPAFKSVFQEIKNTINSSVHNNYVQELVIYDTNSNSIIENFNWDNFYKYFSMDGLQNSSSFNSEISNNPIENLKYSQYNNINNFLTKECQ